MPFDIFVLVQYANFFCLCFRFQVKRILASVNKTIVNNDEVVEPKKISSLDPHQPTCLHKIYGVLGRNENSIRISKKANHSILGRFEAYGIHKDEQEIIGSRDQLSSLPKIPSGCNPIFLVCKIA